MAEHPSGSLPAVDTYAVVLSKQPTDTVFYTSTADAMTELSVCDKDFHCSPYGSSATLNFAPDKYNEVQYVRVRAIDDNLPQGLH